MVSKKNKQQNSKKIKKQKKVTEPVKLDQVLKSLFTVSQPVLLDMLNTLFEENYKIEDTLITLGNNEFITSAYEIIRGDLFFDIEKSEKKQVYHIELQTKNDTSMIIRMFEYGWSKAKEIHNTIKKDDNGKTINEIEFEMPRQLVMFIEENANIQNEIKMKIIFPDKQEVTYKVPVMKCWEYSTEKMVQKKLYPLLPLQLFKLRKKLDSLSSDKEKNKKEIDKKINEVMEIAREISEESSRLQKENIIEIEDLHKILMAIDNLFQYLNNNYGNNPNLNEEVNAMTKTLYDPAVEQRGIKIGETRGIKIGETRGIKIGETRGIKIGETRGIKIGETRGIVKAVIEMGSEFGLPKEKILLILQEKLNISEEKALQYFEEFNK